VDRDVGRVQEIVRAFVESGQLDKLRIRLDANGRWGIAQAVDTIAELQSVPIEYIEQPCRSATQLRELRKKVTVPIAVDEIIRSDGQYQVSEFADLAIVKVSPLGGIDAVEQLIEKLDVPVRFSSALESSVGLSSSLLAAHKFAPDQVAGLGTGMLLATDTVKQSVIPHEGRIRVVKCEPDQEQLGRVPLSQIQQDLWRERLAKAWELIPESQLASWGVPKWSVQG
jgi:O-succinylbenzoate synthase